jgi:hypothetical protein
MSTGEEEEVVTITADDFKLDNQKHVFNIKCNNDKDEYRLVGRPCELSAFSFVPTSRDYETNDRTIYNYKREESNLMQNYDRLFKIDYDFNNKVHRDDRRNAKQYGLKVWNEEITKVTPTRSSSQYGKRQLDVIDKSKPIVNYVSKLDPPTRYVRLLFL